MQIEIFAACDSAQKIGEKLNLTGVFDKFYADEPPNHLPDFTVILKVRLTQDDPGPHEFLLQMSDADNLLLFHNDGLKFPSIPPDEPDAVIQGIYPVSGIPFHSFGDTYLKLFYNGSLCSTVRVHVMRNK